MSLGDAHIMMFYGRAESVNLTHNTKFITITFTTTFITITSIISVYYQEAKTIDFNQCLIILGETSQGQPNCVLMSLGRPQDVSFKHNTKHITVVFFRSYSLNVLREILKS